MNKYIVHYNYNIYKLLTQALKKLKQIERKISIVHLIIWEKALFYIHVLANCYNHSSLSIGNVFVYVHILYFTLKFPLRCPFGFFICLSKWRGVLFRLYHWSENGAKLKTASFCFEFIGWKRRVTFTSPIIG